MVADKLKTWFKGFINAIKRWKPKQATIYGAQYTRNIKDGTFTFRKVITYFEKSLDKDAKIKRGIIIKEAFGPMFDGKGFERAGIKRNKAP